MRVAHPSDAPELARVQVQAWRESFTHMLSPRTLADLDVDETTTVWKATLGDPKRVTHVGIVNGEIVGFIIVGASRDADAPCELEVQMLYTLDAVKGAGMGQMLVDAGLGGRPASLWCATLNPRARTFYERNGFRADGVTKMVDAGRDQVVNERLVR